MHGCCHGCCRKLCCVGGWVVGCGSGWVRMRTYILLRIRAQVRAVCAHKSFGTRWAVRVCLRAHNPPTPAGLVGVFLRIQRPLLRMLQLPHSLHAPAASPNSEMVLRLCHTRRGVAEQLELNCAWAVAAPWGKGSPADCCMTHAPQQQCLPSIKRHHGHFHALSTKQHHCFSAAHTSNSAGHIRPLSTNLRMP